jgi:hypothetical protein
VDLAEELTDLIRILFEDLLDVRTEQGREAHGGAAQTNQGRSTGPGSSAGRGTVNGGPARGRR